MASLPPREGAVEEGSGRMDAGKEGDAGKDDTVRKDRPEKEDIAGKKVAFMDRYLVSWLSVMGQSFGLDFDIRYAFV